ncbi:acetaldehyde dehydrogenase (acetylating) [Lysinibacillus odysseyi]|uniref:Acetaldehyde dehydrogenase n=1 Tax=Lysinibacillus odysseyi 34hs-1 = NBRC 100172 TaxID=1220589 RepID=A0A0A3IN77_9BACI|nr:acetaldehyde dehydrogenase (acetylating) [Lysinibacillus odysseyi]KGR84915.1 acetaldehyde dehydrogenase [Lysinibacillus odysseyi 34hs-1 = NBRC 100172]
MKKLKVGIIGSGNIGTDLMKKVMRSELLHMSVVIGIDPDSDGLKKAKDAGVHTISNGIEGFLEHPELADVLFDATSAKAHTKHVELLEPLGKKIIDLTPAAIGPFVVPTVNLERHLNESVVNMITCGGQATIPVIHAIQQVQNVEYAEIVATIASKSAGPGTRANIDEFTQTTARAIEEVGGAKKGKAIIILNPAEPPMLMRDTVSCLLEEDVKEPDQMKTAIEQIVKDVNSYVPGYRLKIDPLIEGREVKVFLEVEGLGDYLPVYAGNLDIMTAAALKVGEIMAQQLQKKEVGI